MLHTFSNFDSLICLNSHGCRIEKLILNKVVILGTVIREDGKTESTHPCTLQHNYDREGKNKHGKGRDSEWEIMETENGLIATCTLNSVEVSQEFILFDDSCTITTTHKNNGMEVATNFAEHNYFLTPGGNDNVLFNNELVIKQLKEERGKNGFDYIMCDMKEINTISIMGNEKVNVIQLSQPASLPFQYVAIWVMGKDRSYVCIEPVVGNAQKDYIMSKKAILPAGKSETMQFTLRILSPLPL